MARSLPLSLLVLLCCSRWCTGQECNKAETIEAEEAFKNCVESAQVGIVGRAAKQEPQVGNEGKKVRRRQFNTVLCTAP